MNWVNRKSRKSKNKCLRLVRHAITQCASHRIASISFFCRLLEQTNENARDGTTMLSVSMDSPQKSVAMRASQHHIPSSCYRTVCPCEFNGKCIQFVIRQIFASFFPSFYFVASSVHRLPLIWSDHTLASHIFCVRTTFRAAFNRARASGNRWACTLHTVPSSPNECTKCSSPASPKWDLLKVCARARSFALWRCRNAILQCLAAVVLSLAVEGEIK